MKIQRFLFHNYVKIENFVGKFLFFVFFIFLLRKIGIPLHTLDLLYKSGV